MSTIPDRAALRAELSGFEDREKQIVGALFALMIAHPERVKDREWISEQFVRLAGVHFDGEATRGGGVSLPPELEAYTLEYSAPVLNACYALFVRVGEDLTESTDSDANAAVHRALAYFEG